MHVLQPKHIKLSDGEVEKLLTSLNISKAQLPKIFLNDAALPEGCNVGDVIRIERKIDSVSIKKEKPKSENMTSYFRVIV
jgi:DNA-directed RNA polymerase subunit H (RpoH/RPB5)